MSVDRNAAVENRLEVSAVLFALCLLTLLVSLFGLFRTSGITQTRAGDLQVSWQALMDDGVKGAEVVATDRLMQSVTRPVPAIHSAASWSLAMGGLSLVFFVWHLVSVRSVRRGRNSLEIQRARNDQAAISKLLDEMAPLASGDLGVRATARDGTVGALADAFNHAVSELHRLAEVQLSTSRALGESVNQSNKIRESVEQQCKQQVGHIHQSSNVLLGMSSSTAALSANTADALAATEEIVNTSDTVAAAFQVNRKQVDGMRRDSDMCITLMHSMEQHGGSIEDAVALLQDLARRTDLLAVNATIRVSAVGSDVASEDIGQLTDEVSRLANALSRAIDDIGSSTSNLSSDIAEAVICMQRLYANSDAQAAHERAQTELLAQIRKASRKAQTHTSLMATQAVTHAGVVKDLSEKMNLMIRNTEQTGKDAQTNAVFMEGLKKIANELRQSTSDFNLNDNHSVFIDDRQIKSVARRAAERAAING